MMSKLNKLKNNEIFFEKEFSSLNRYFKIESDLEVKEFLKDNVGIFLILDEIKPYLDEYFLDDEYCLELIQDPEIEDYTQLVLRVYVSEYRFNNGVREDINYIRKEISPLRREFKIFTEFALRPGVLNV